MVSCTLDLWPNPHYTETIITHLPTGRLTAPEHTCTSLPWLSHTECRMTCLKRLRRLPLDYWFSPFDLYLTTTKNAYPHRNGSATFCVVSLFIFFHLKNNCVLLLSTSGKTQFIYAGNYRGKGIHRPSALFFLSLCIFIFFMKRKWLKENMSESE